MFSFIKKLDWRYIFYRAGKTFMYSAVPVMVLTVQTNAGSFGSESLVTAATAGGAAGFSAVWNILVKPKVVEAEKRLEAAKSYGEVTRVLTDVAGEPLPPEHPAA